MWRFTDRTVLSGFVIAWRLATSPTRTSPSLEATTDGVVRDPSALGMMTGSPPYRAAITLLVVPRSIPTALAMVVLSVCFVVEDRSNVHRVQPECTHVIFHESDCWVSARLVEAERNSTRT